MVEIDYIIEIAAPVNVNAEMQSLERILLENGITIQKAYELIPAYHVSISDESVAKGLRELGYIVEPVQELHI